MTRRELVATVGTVTVTGCGSRRNGTATPTDTPQPPATDARPVDHREFGFTHHQSTGNRVIDGRGDIAAADPIDISVEMTPRWLVGGTAGSEAIFVAVGVDGRVRGVGIDGDGRIEVGTDTLPAGMPPVLDARSGDPTLVTPPPTAEPTAGILPLGNGSLLFVDENGSVGRWNGSSVVDSVSIDALPDARIVRAGVTRAAILSGATTRYDHGVLGDAIEAERVTMLDTDNGLTVDFHAKPASGVIEGQAPIVADLSDAERPNLIVTASGPRDGARLVSFDPDGRGVASGPPIGSGFRWRHQLAVAPFADDSTAELAVVRTPHIGGRLEFYRQEGDRLSIVATREGYASHRIGSRNLDTAVAGDFDGDGRPEIVVPRPDYGRISGVGRSGEGTVERWTRGCGGEIATNLAAAHRGNGGLTLGVGRTDGRVRLWV